MNVLIVDDNDSCIQLLKRVMEFIPDTQTTAALSGSEAWWHLSDQGKSFDLLIADINMPVINGLTLAQRIRATPSLKNLRIIFCSALADRKTIENLQQLGVSQYVVKPYGVATMINKINLAMSLSVPTDPAPVGA